MATAVSIVPIQCQPLHPVEDHDLNVAGRTEWKLISKAQPASPGFYEIRERRTPHIVRRYFDGVKWYHTKGGLKAEFYNDAQWRGRKIH